MNLKPSSGDNPSPEPRWLLPLADAILCLVAFALAYIIRYEWQLIRPVLDPSQADFAPYLPYAAFYSFLLLMSYQGSGLYRHVRGRAFMEEVYIILNGVTVATVILLALFFLVQPLVTSRLMLVYVATLTVILLSSARLIRRMVWAHLRSKGVGVQNVLIVGMGEVGQAVLRSIIARPELGYKVIGYLDQKRNGENADLGRVKAFGDLDDLLAVLQSQRVDLVVITLRWQYYNRILGLARTARDAGVQVRVVPDLFQLNLRQVQFENLDGIPMLGVDGVEPVRGTRRLFKRALDLSLTLLAAPLWVTLVVAIALAIKLEDGGDIFYTSIRIGENGRRFRMIKFRSMIPDADQYRHQLIHETGDDIRRPKIENDPRITRVGDIIRRTSLDELPNLFNVIMGQMSLVGPRPPLPDEVAHYEPWHLQRLGTIPGMTGLWQVSGRSDIPFDEMCLLDIYYIENWSLRLDLQILMMTLPRVIMRSGAY